MCNSYLRRRPGSFTHNASLTSSDRPLHHQCSHLRLRSPHRDRFRMLPPVRLCGHSGSPRAITHVLRRHLHVAGYAASYTLYAPFCSLRNQLKSWAFLSLYPSPERSSSTTRSAGCRRYCLVYRGRSYRLLYQA